MNAKQRKTEGTAKGPSPFQCQPEQFQKMFELMSSCCVREGDISDCSAMMKRMMDQMKEKASGAATPKTRKTGNTTA